MRLLPGSTINGENIETTSGAQEKVNVVKDMVGNLSSLKTTAKGDTVSAINELFQSASDGKTAISTAITGKGVASTPADSFTTMATKIGQIETEHPITGEIIRNIKVEDNYSKGDPVTILDALSIPGGLVRNIRSGEVPTGNANRCEYSKNGKYFAIAGSSGVQVYERKEGVMSKVVISGLPSTANDVAFSPDGSFMAVGASASPYLHVYRITNGAFVKIGSPAASSVVNGVTFSDDSQHLVATVSASPYVIIYVRDGDLFNSTISPSALPGGVGRGAEYSPKGTYLTIMHNAEPFVTIYKRSGNSYTKLANLDLPSGFSENLAYRATFSPDENYLCTIISFGERVHIFKRSGDTFTKLPNIDSFGSGTTGASFSPDGSMLAFAGANVPYATVYKRSGDTFTKIPNFYDAPKNITNDVKFSPDGKYLTLTGITTPFYYMYRVTPTLDLSTSADMAVLNLAPDLPTDVTTYMDVCGDLLVTTVKTGYYNSNPKSFIVDGDRLKSLSTNVFELKTPRGIAISPDGTHVAFASSGDSPNVSIWKRIDNTLNLLTNLAPASSTLVSGVAYSPDGAYLYVVHQSSPFITQYTRNGDSYGAVGNPNVLPSATANAVAVSQDDSRVAVGFNNSPYIIIYTKTGNSLTKVADPVVLPDISVLDITFSPDGRFVVLTTNRTPFIYIYKIESNLTWTKLPNPSVLPGGTVVGCRFSPDGNYLAVPTYGSPYLLIYKISGDTFTKLANPSTLPSGITKQAVFSSDSSKLFVYVDGEKLLTYSLNKDFTARSFPTMLPNHGYGYLKENAVSGQTKKVALLPFKPQGGF